MENIKTCITCVLCPKSCTVVILKRAKDLDISGHECDRGKDYAIKELINPQRILTTTVRTVFKDFPRLPVKTDKPVPLGEVFKYMDIINTILVKKRLKPGDRIDKQLPDKDINLIATDDMTIIL